MPTYHPQSDMGKALASRDSTSCPYCNGNKKPGYTVCRVCWRDLPYNLSKKLYGSDEKWLEARDEALDWLKENVKL